MAYLPLMQFMLQYESYAWAWEVEFDVRYIGHWGRWGCLLESNSPLDIGSSAALPAGSSLSIDIGQSQNEIKNENAGRRSWICCKHPHRTTQSGCPGPSPWA